MTAADVLGLVDELPDGTGGSVDPMGAAKHPIEGGAGHEERTARGTTTVRTPRSPSHEECARWLSPWRYALRVQLRLLWDVLPPPLGPRSRPSRRAARRQVPTRQRQSFWRSLGLCPRRSQGLITLTVAFRDTPAGSPLARHRCRGPRG